MHPRTAATAPTGNSEASGTKPPPGTMDVYAFDNDGTKIYIGWLTSKPIAALLS